MARHLIPKSSQLSRDDLTFLKTEARPTILLLKTSLLEDLQALNSFEQQTLKSFVFAFFSHPPDSLQNELSLKTGITSDFKKRISSQRQRLLSHLKSLERLLAPPSKTPKLHKLFDLPKLKAIPFEALIPTEALSVPLGPTALFLCPLHEESTPSFRVYSKDNHFYCFGCNKTGDTISFIQLRDKCSFRTACKVLEGYVT